MELNNPTEDKKEVSNNSTKEVYMAPEFLSGFKRGRYGVLLNDIHNAFWMGHNKYPKTLKSADYLSINWKGDSKRSSVALNKGTAFTT